MGFFCGTAGAMANEIGIPFAGVQVLCGGASGVSSEVWVQSAGVVWHPGSERPVYHALPA